MATPHNEAELGDIAKTVLMPGDPLRAEYIAKEFLSDVKKFNSVRNIYGYTGKYKGKDLSVMASGMGMPSMAIYSYELYTQYEVDNIIRIGSAGSLLDSIGLRDIILAMSTSTDSNYAKQYRLPGTFAPTADFDLLLKAYNKAQDLGCKVHVGNVISTDVFYNANEDFNKAWADMNVLGVEMEAAALYMNAAKLSKKALAILTVSDNLNTGEGLSAIERQQGFKDMITLALETSVVL